jgi:hypothetical protein
MDECLPEHYSRYFITVESVSEPGPILISGFVHIRRTAPLSLDEVVTGSLNAYLNEHPGLGPVVVVDQTVEYLGFLPGVVTGPKTKE